MSGSRSKLAAPQAGQLREWPVRSLVAVSESSVSNEAQDRSPLQPFQSRAIPAKNSGKPSDWYELTSASAVNPRWRRTARK